MSFRNRKISDKAAHAIGRTIAEERFDEDLLNANDAYATAKVTLEEAMKAKVDTCPAATCWYDIPLEKREHLTEAMAQYNRDYEARWSRHIRIVASITRTDEEGEERVEDNECVELELDWWYMPRSLARGELPLFIGDEAAAKWDVKDWIDTTRSFVNMPEHVAAVALYDVWAELDRSKNKVCTELFQELRDRSTKEVIEAWPEAEKHIHMHYEYQGSVLNAPIAHPLDVFIQNAKTPAITMQQAEAAE
tara:strand:+ start:2397 stop:3143 length:747 start_codon:yes stop_codon:yes gene_type:complete